MAKSTEEEITIEGYLNSTDYIKYHNGEANNRAWKLGSFNLSISCTGFGAIEEEIRQLTGKQNLRITGKPKVTEKGGKRYWGINITSIEDANTPPQGDDPPAPLPAKQIPLPVVEEEEVDPLDANFL